MAIKTSVDIDWKWHWPSIDVELSIHPDVYFYLGQNIQLDNENEKGGQIFMNINHPQGLTIISATPPHSSDMSGPTWLELDDARCKQEIIEHNEIGMKLVGYWHTHPQDIPELSSQDIKSFKNFAVRNKDILPNPLAIIVGRAKTQEGIRIWSFQNLNPIIAVIKNKF